MTSKCVNLIDIGVYFHGRSHIDCSSLSPYDSTFAPLRDKVVFNYAKSLFVHSGFRVALTTIVQDFTFPSLDKLQFLSTGHSVSLIDHSTSLSEGLRTTLSFFSGLTTLRLLRVEIGDANLLEIFHSTPLLTMLDIMLGVYYQHQFLLNDAGVVNHLTIDGTQSLPPILPRLRDLRLYYCPDEEYPVAENFTRYVSLAISRFHWAQSHMNVRDEGVPPSKITQDLPTYPFRLYMKFNADYFYSKLEPIRRAFPDAEYPIFWPEISRSYSKEV
ncbi:hypothetical protein CPB83DRAFT_865238 [Crepidotus variabilis]|uniref:Uncharacterized protein n=1 Tax=Crepidotus variabilis TaxID=179855 RepID=A0A9P6JHU3_9AGAR|nr:hypothetical protein CPB83DRAFT_865238 [Crepidotus variabilis]